MPTPQPETSLTPTAARGIDALQVVDELREIFDGVDVVVRRRADEQDAGLRVAQTGDQAGDLVAGKLAALAGLGALRDFDLDLFGVGEVLGGDAEAAGGDLLDLVVEQRPTTAPPRAADRAGPST